MRHFLLVVLIAIFPTSATANVNGVSNNIGQTGFYSQIKLGNDYPRLQLLYSKPVLIKEARLDLGQHLLPIYLPNYDNHRYIFAQNGYYESNRRYDDGYQDRRYDSHRNHDDHNQGMRRNNGNYKQGDDSNRGKYDKDRHGSKSRDRDRSR